MYHYVIYGTYQGEKEEIDTAEDRYTLNYLLGEYRLAYGHEWTITWKRERIKE